MQCRTESGTPWRLYVVRRLLRPGGLAQFDFGGTGTRVDVHGTWPGYECCGSDNNERTIPCSGPGLFRCLWSSSILTASELGLGLRACAHLPRPKQHLLFAHMYSSINILVETRDEGVLR